MSVTFTGPSLGKTATPDSSTGNSPDHSGSRQTFSLMMSPGRRRLRVPVESDCVDWMFSDDWAQADPGHAVPQARRGSKMKRMAFMLGNVGSFYYSVEVGMTHSWDVPSLPQYAPRADDGKRWQVGSRRAPSTGVPFRMLGRPTR